MWRHIVVEGYCFAKTGGNKKPPCGNETATTFCLSNGLCPHFAYAKSSEREAAYWVPLRLILWDRFRYGAGNSWDWIRWQVWDRWFWKQRNAEFIASVERHTVKCPEVDSQLQKAKDEFPKWFEVAKKEWING